MDEGDAFFMVMASFLAMEPALRLIQLARASGHGRLSQRFQAFLHHSCLNHSVARRFPPSNVYVRNLLKHVILEAEAEGEEVLDALYQALLIASAPSHTHQISSECEVETHGNNNDRCYKSYLFSMSKDVIAKLSGCVGNEHASKFLDMILTLRVSLNMLDGSTGCYVWPAGIYLSEFLLGNPHIFTGKCCLEIGAGAGLSSLCLARLRASKVIATDGNLSTIANLKHNFSLNAMLPKDEQQSAKVEFRELLWEMATEDEVKSFNADIIIGADIIYDPVCVPHLVRLLSWLLSKRKQDKDESCVLNSMPIAFIATVVRNMDTLNMFMSSAHLAGLVVEDIPESMRPPILLPQVTEIDRSTILLYRVKSR